MSKNLELNLVLGATVAGAVSGMMQVANAMKNASKSIKELDQKTKELQKTQKSFEKMDKIRESYNRITQQFKATKEHLEKLKAEYEKSGYENKDLAKQIKQTEKAVETLNKQKERQKHMFEAARSAIEAEGASLQNYRNKAQEVDKELEKMNKLKEIQGKYEARKEFAGKMNDFGDKQIIQGMGIVGALAVPVKLAVDLENAQADLKKVADFSSKQMETGFYKAMRNFSENSPLSQVELFQIAGAGAQAGIKTDELERYTKDAAKIKVAFDMNTEAAGNFLAKTRAQLNLDQNGVMQYADVINYLANTVAVTAPEVADISSRVAGLGGMAGISKEGVAGLGASLVSFGVPSEVAATGLKNISLGLMAGTSATKKQAAAFKLLGLDVEDVAKRMTKDGEGTLIDVFQRIKKLPKDVQAATLKELFGKESIQSASELAKHIDEVSKNMKNAHDRAKTAGSVDKEYNQRLKTMGNAFSTLKNRIINMGVDLGSALGPSLVQVANSIGPLIKKFSQFIQKHPQLTTNILKGVAAFAAFKIGIGGLAKGFAPLFSGISKGMLIFDKFKVAGNFADGFKTAFPVLSKIGATLKPLGKAGFNGLIGGIKAGGSAFKTMLNPINMVKLAFNGLKLGGSSAIKIFKLMLNPFKMLRGAIGIIKSVGIAIKMAFLANPVGVIIGAIVGLIAIFVILYNKSTWFRNGINNAMKQIMPHVKELGRTIKQGIGQAITWVSNKMKQAGPHMRNVWNSLKPVLSVIGTIIKVVIIVAIRLAISAVRALGSTFKFLSTVAGGVFKMISSAIKTAIAVWKGVFNLFIAFFTGKWNEIPGIISGVWESVKSGISGFVNGAKSILNGLFDWFKNQWNNLKSLVSGGLGAVGGLFGKNAAGTNYWSGGLTTVAERGAELIKMPGKPAFLAEHEMLLNLPRGTQILNNRETRSNLRAGVSSLKEKISGLRNENSGGGDNINISITVNGNADTNAIERAVMRALEKARNKKERTAFG